MKKDYKFLRPVIKILNKSEYTCLVDANPCAEGFEERKYIEKTVSVIKELKEYFSNQTYHDSESDELITREATDKIISKILLATLGSVPAYDTYVSAGLKAANICGTLGERGCKSLVAFCQDHKNELNKLLIKVEKDYGVKYPMMKIIDMIFWEYGCEIKK